MGEIEDEISLAQLLRQLMLVRDSISEIQL